MFEFSNEYKAWQAVRIDKVNGITELTCKGCSMAPYSCPGCTLTINK
jgi:hypothetical protein